jgi:hypothetical protein
VQRKRFFWVLSLLLFCGWMMGCSSPLRMTVLYDRAEGLKPGDRVFWKDQTIGTVEKIEVNSQGRYSVRLRIQQDFRRMLTDQSRFILQADPLHPRNRSVEMIRLAPGGEPLSDGDSIEGSSTISVLLEQGQNELESWSKLFQEGLERLEKEIDQLPERELFKDLERQMENWTRELERSGEEIRRYFRDEVLPQLEESMRELRRRFPEREEEKDLKALEKKLEQMKNLSRGA